jgi:hypothetical protein
MRISAKALFARWSVILLLAFCLSPSVSGISWLNACKECEYLDDLAICVGTYDNQLGWSSCQIRPRCILGECIEYCDLWNTCYLV